MPAVSTPLVPGSLRPAPLDVGGVLSNTFTVFRHGFGIFALAGFVPNLVIFAVALVTAIPLALGVASWASVGGEGGALVLGALAVMAIGGLGGALLQAKAAGVSAVATEAIAAGRPTRFGQAWQESRGMVRRVLGVYLLLGLLYLVIFGAMLGSLGGVLGTAVLTGGTPSEAAVAQLLSMVVTFILLGIVAALVSWYLTIRFLYFIPVVALERVNGMGALGRSWQLTRGSFWRTLGVWLLISVLVGAVSGAVSMINQVMVGPLQRSLEDAGSAGQTGAILAALLPVMIVSGLLTMAVSTLATPFMTVASTVMYADQVRRLEPGAPESSMSGYPAGTPGAWGAAPWPGAGATWPGGAVPGAGPGSAGVGIVPGAGGPTPAPGAGWGAGSTTGGAGWSGGPGLATPPPQGGWTAPGGQAGPPPVQPWPEAPGQGPDPYQRPPRAS